MTTPSYKVFARAYRPTSFKEVMGQDVAVRIFQNALKQNTLSHAILLTGIRGIGKTTSARLLAKSLCCTSPVNDIDPCGECPSCQAFDHDRHTDIVEMDAASHTGVDDIREIIEGVSYAPVYGRYRVYIIDEVHMLSKNAFNALLKTLEEPPAHATFIFATTEIEKVPETILSRCLQIQLRPMALETILNQLTHVCQQEHLACEVEGLTLIAEAANGSMRDALSILEKVASFTRSSGESMTLSVVERVLGRPPQENVMALCNGIKTGDIKTAIEVVRYFFTHDIEPLSIAKSLLKEIHGNLCARVMASPAASQHPFHELQVTQLNRLWSIVQAAAHEISASLTPKESCEVMLIRLCHVSDLPPLKQLIHDMEQKLSTFQNSTPMAAPAITSETAPTSIFRTFDQLVDWAHSLRDPHLSFFLKRDLHVHGFRQGYVECSLKNPTDQSLLIQLKQLIKDHTQETWTFEVVHTSPATTPLTLHEQALEKEAAHKESILQSDLVQYAAKMFENADILLEKTPELLKN